MDIKDKERVAITEKTLIYLKKHFQIFISNLTLSEINNAPQNVKNKLIEIIKEIKPIVLGETEKSIILAENYTKEKIIPKNIEMMQDILQSLF